MCAGLRPLRVHDLRHTFGTRVIGVADIRRVQEWMGHANVQTTMQYLHYVPRPQDAALVAAVIERWIADVQDLRAELTSEPWPGRASDAALARMPVPRMGAGTNSGVRYGMPRYFNDGNSWCFVPRGHELQLHYLRLR